jgi:hypothetical protein
MKEDILEQLVDDYLKSNGFAVWEPKLAPNRVQMRDFALLSVPHFAGSKKS